MYLSQTGLMMCLRARPATAMGMRRMAGVQTCVLAADRGQRLHALGTLRPSCGARCC